MKLTPLEEKVLRCLKEHGATSLYRLSEILNEDHHCVRVAVFALIDMQLLTEIRSFMVSDRGEETLQESHEI